MCIVDGIGRRSFGIFIFGSFEVKEREEEVIGLVREYIEIIRYDYVVIVKGINDGV